jgi:hypothetical protein
MQTDTGKEQQWRRGNNTKADQNDETSLFLRFGFNTSQ